MNSVRLEYPLAFDVDAVARDSNIRRLQSRTPEFARWRESNHVRSGGGAWDKVLTHPGEVDSAISKYLSFQANDETSLKLVICTPIAR